MDKELPVFTLSYDLLKWFCSKYDEYPKKYKYILGEKLTNTLLEMVDDITEARFRKVKGDYISSALTKSEKAKYLARLSKDMNCISIGDYEKFSISIVEIGKMLTGWQKYILK